MNPGFLGTGNQVVDVLQQNSSSTDPSFGFHPKSAQS